MPESRPTPWMATRAGIGHGTVRQARFEGGDASAARPVWFYRPAAGPPSGLLVLLDGGVWHNVISVPTMLDNLAADGRLAPPAVVLVGHPAVAARDVEYRCSTAFADLLADQLVPWAAEEFGLAPAFVAVGGLARGGLAAVHAVLARRDAMDAAIALSGSFWWSPQDDDESEWLTRTLAVREIRPARFWLAAGRLEDHVSAARKGTSTLSASRSLARALSRSGHDVHHETFPGGHEAVPHRATMADALVWLFPPSPSAGRAHAAGSATGRNPHRAG